MEEIVKVHFPNVEENLLKQAMDAFYEIRSLHDIRKKPSTSELIDWVNALQIGGISADRIKAELPFVGVVVKKDEDLELVKHGRHVYGVLRKLKRKRASRDLWRVFDVAGGLR